VAETKLKGLKILYDDDYIEIRDAYKINSKRKMEDIINETFEKNIFCKIKRSMGSMTRQWSTRNRLYRLHIFRNYTKNYKIKIKQNPISTFFCLILGFEHKKIRKIISKIIKKIKTLRKENRYE
jgi:hypothetical protein